MVANVAEILNTLTAEQIATLLALAAKVQTAPAATPVQQAVAATSSVATPRAPRKAGIGEVGDETLNERPVPDDAWESAQVTDRLLENDEMIAISQHGADALIREGNHPANTVRVRWVREDKDDPKNQRALLAFYHTDADGVDCDEPTLKGLREFEQETDFARAVLTNPLNAAQNVWGASRALQDGEVILNPFTNEPMPRASVYTVQTLVFEMELGGVKQPRRFFLPKNVSEVLITRYKKNTPENRAKALLGGSGPLTMPAIHRFDATVRLAGLLNRMNVIDQVIAGQFRFSSIRSAQFRQRAVNVVANALRMARTNSIADREQLAQTLLNDASALPEYRAINLQTRKQEQPVTTEQPLVEDEPPF